MNATMNATTNTIRTSSDGPYRKGINDGYDMADSYIIEHEGELPDESHGYDWYEYLVNQVGHDEARRYLCDLSARTQGRYNRGCDHGYNQRIAEQSAR